MKKDDISDCAQDVLAYTIILEKNIKTSKVKNQKLATAMNILLETLSFDIRRTYIEAINELKRKHYIKVKGDLICDDDWSNVLDALSIRYRGRCYFKKYMRFSESLAVVEKEIPDSLCDEIKKRSETINENSIFKLVISIVTVVASIFSICSTFIK